MKITNSEIAKALDISVRAVQYKRKRVTDWTLPEYETLIKFFGKDDADKIIYGEDLK